MSDSNRGGISKTLADNWRPLCVIAVGLILTVYLAWRLQPEQPYLPRYQPAYSKAAGYQSGGRDCSPAALNAIGDIRERAAKSDDCANKAEDYRMKADDLIQQTRAADASQSQARSAYEQGWLALWATLGGLWTLIAAGLAAAYARDAAREGSRSADAGENAIIEARRIGEAQVRAYVNVASARISITKSMLWIDVTFKNTGQSPASEVRAGFTPAIWLVGTGAPKVIETVENYFETEKSVDGGVIGSGDESNSVETVWTFSFEDHANFRLAEKFGSTDALSVAVLLTFNLTWSDVFGKQQSVYGVVNAGDFRSSTIAGQNCITSVGKARNEDFDVAKWVERKKRSAGKK